MQLWPSASIRRYEDVLRARRESSDADTAALGRCIGATTPTSDRQIRNALSAHERGAVLAALNSERFADLSPPQVFAQLLDEGVYLVASQPANRNARHYRKPSGLISRVKTTASRHECTLFRETYRYQTA